MAKNDIYKLTPRKRARLEESFNASSSETYRMRCQIVLLKSDGLTNKEIAQRLGCNPITVAKWLKRYHIEGLKGLAETQWVWVKEGDSRSDAEIKAAIEKHRRELAKAKEEWHNEMEQTGTQGEAFDRFLSLLAQDI